MTLGEFRALTAKMGDDVPLLKHTGLDFWVPARAWVKDVAHTAKGYTGHYFDPHPFDQEKYEMKEAVIVS